MTDDSGSNVSYTTPDGELNLLGKELSDFVIAYLSCPQDSGRNYLGGLLLTDYRTRPLEFAVVSPVKVSVMQRIIHGRTLDEAITVDVVARRLLSEATKPPDIIFVDSDLLLGLQRLTEIPVAKLSREQNSVSQPTTISTLKYSTSRTADNESTVGEVLATLEGHADLLDPFTRMTEAIREAQKSIPPPQGKP